MRYFLLLFFLIHSASFAQTGNYFLSHHSPGQDRHDNICFQIAQHQNGVIYFATRTGILQFDGRTWNEINTHGAAYTLHITDEGVIFWGGVNGFGRINFNSQGTPSASTLFSKAKNIFQSVRVKESLYLINEDTIFVASTKGGISKTIPYTHPEGTLSGLHEIAGAVYVTTTDGKLLWIDGDEAKPTASASAYSDLVFSAAFKGRYIFGVANNEIYLQEDGKRPRKLILDDQEYLNRSVVVQGTWVSNDLIVLGTLRGGLVFINIGNGKTYEIVNSTKGLPDNEIFTLFSDRSQGVWAAHEFGFTRVVPYLPFRSFHHYSGLQGNLLCAISFNNSVFVGTSLGLFKLEKEDVYEEIRYFVDVPAKGKPRLRSGKASEKSTTDAPSKTETKRGGFLGLFKKKKLPNGDDEATLRESLSRKDNGGTSDGKVLRTERIYRNSNWVYRKVKGVEAKVTQLLEINGKLIAAGLGGTFEVNGLSGKLLLDEPSRYVYGTRDGLLFVSTYADKVYVLKRDNNRWRNRELLVNINDQISHMFESDNEDVWLCSLDKFYRVTIRDRDISDVRVIPINNPNYDYLVGISFQKRLLFVGSSGFFQYHEGENNFHKIDSLSRDELTNYFASGRSLWYRDVHGWKSLSEDFINPNPGLLNLFKNIRFLHPDKRSGDLWLITGNNELFKFYKDEATPSAPAFPLMLKTVRNGELKQGGKRLDVLSEHTSNGVSIEVVQPDYLGSMAVEYRYRLKGLDLDWSEWSQANNLVEIPFLPSGDYVLQVQSKNVLGIESSMEELVLNIIPPYWKRPWFYALEVMLFSLLIVLSFRLSVRYRIISRLLMLVTIVILIQLAETLIGDTLETNTSPVIDFIVQVAIAMLILPVEGFLRERMLRSLEVRDRFSRIILPRVPRKMDESAVDN